MATTKKTVRTQKRQPATGDEILHIEIKRRHLWALIAPLTFLLGLWAGYLLWGRAPAAAAPSAADSADVGTQIEGLQRYDINLDGDPVLGPMDAPVTIVEFADFQCPYCVRHFEQTMPQLMERYGDQVRFVFKNYPLNSIHPDADAAAQAAECANEQGKFWEYHDLLFGGTLGLGPSAYTTYAEQLGLDVAALSTCLAEGRYADAVNQDLALGQQYGVSSTPTFFINGIALVGAYPFDTFASIIDYELANR